MYLSRLDPELPLPVLRVPVPVLLRVPVPLVPVLQLPASLKVYTRYRSKTAGVCRTLPGPLLHPLF
jgi:hypothetical protein